MHTKLISFNKSLEIYIASVVALYSICFRMLAKLCFDVSEREAVISTGNLRALPAAHACADVVVFLCQYACHALILQSIHNISS